MANPNLLGALLQGYDLLLEAVEREAEAADKLEGLSLLGLFLKVLATVFVDGIELIAHRQVFVHFVLHII